MARKVRDGETDIMNTDAAKVNPKPLYPEIWYKEKGGKKPVFSSEPEAASSSEVSSGAEDADAPVSGFNAGTVSAEQSSQASKPNTTSSKTTTSKAAASSNTTTSKAPAVTSAPSSSKPSASSSPSSKPQAPTTSITSGQSSSDTVTP